MKGRFQFTNMKFIHRCVCAFYVYEFFPSYPNIVAILTKKAEYLDLALILARGFFTRPEKGF